MRGKKVPYQLLIRAVEIPRAGDTLITELVRVRPKRGSFLFHIKLTNIQSSALKFFGISVSAFMRQFR